MHALTFLFGLVALLVSAGAVASTPDAPREWAARAWVESQRHSFNDERYSLVVAGVTGGVQISPGVMIEGNVGVGVGDDTDQGATLELNRALSLSLRMTAPPSASGYRLMSRMGVSVVSLEQRNPSLTDEDFSGGHFSLGVERAIRPNLSWTVEVVYTALDSDIDTGALRAGLSWVVSR